MILNEVKKSEIISNSRNKGLYKDQSKGKNRFQRRVHSSVKNSVQNFNVIDMNKLFKDNILDVGVSVKGETDDYIVRVSFIGFLDELHDILTKYNIEKVNHRAVEMALRRSIAQSDNVRVSCNCPDFKYRFTYWLNAADILDFHDEDHSSDMNKALSEKPKYERTNSNNDMGMGCKHILLVLGNISWLMKLASTIYNYINYMEKHYQRLYADVIFPAVYDREYTDDVQLQIDDNGNDELSTSKDEIDVSNKYARTKDLFKKGNKSGIRFTSDNPTKELDFDSLMSD